MAVVEVTKSSLNSYLSTKFTGRLQDYAAIASMVDELISAGTTHQDLQTLIGSAVASTNLSRPLTLSGRVSSLTIDFQSNTLVTILNGDERAIKLSNALGISMDLYEVFSAYVEDRLSKESEFHNAIECITKTELMVDGKPRVAVCPYAQRVVFMMPNKQSSVHILQLHALIPLFKKEMIEDLCPELKGTASAFTLLKGLRLAYIGRCMVGAIKAWHEGKYSEDKCLEEFARNIHLLKGGYAFFTEPLV